MPVPPQAQLTQSATPNAPVAALRHPLPANALLSWLHIKANPTIVSENGHGDDNVPAMIFAWTHTINISKPHSIGTRCYLLRIFISFDDLSRWIRFVRNCCRLVIKLWRVFVFTSIYQSRYICMSINRLQLVSKFRNHKKTQINSKLLIRFALCIGIAIKVLDDVVPVHTFLFRQKYLNIQQVWSSAILYLK